jgi:hypothetical protein
MWLTAAAQMCGYAVRFVSWTIIWPYQAVNTKRALLLRPRHSGHPGRAAAILWPLLPLAGKAAFAADPGNGKRRSEQLIGLRIKTVCQFSITSVTRAWSDDRPNS